MKPKTKKPKNIPEFPRAAASQIENFARIAKRDRSIGPKLSNGEVRLTLGEVREDISDIQSCANDLLEKLRRFERKHSYMGFENLKQAALDHLRAGFNFNEKQLSGVSKGFSGYDLQYPLIGLNSLLVFVDEMLASRGGRPKKAELHNLVKWVAEVFEKHGLKVVGGRGSAFSKACVFAFEKAGFPESPENYIKGFIKVRNQRLSPIFDKTSPKKR